MLYHVKVVATAALAALCLPSALLAAPLSQGSFGVAGAFTLSAGSQLSTTDSLFIGNGGSVFITSPGTFDLAGIGGIGDTATLRDIPSLSGFAPVSTFLTAGNGATVDLVSLTIAHRSTNFLNFFGEVDLLAPGFDATPGILSGSATTLDGRRVTLALTIAARPGITGPQPPAEEEPGGEDPDTGNPGPEGPSIEEPDATPDDPTPVPEPWSAAGLALGLGGLALGRRRRKP